jgi:Zn-dependent peptidase ImmA (M78 family)/transcriptional regulator with XRE-family HTH domain
MATEREDWKQLGERLANARKLAGFTQEDVAALLGLSRVALSYIETGERPVSIPLLQRLAEIYRQPLAFFLGRVAPKAADLAQLLYRAAGGDNLLAKTRAGIADFLNFLDAYADLLEEMEEELPGRRIPPYQLVEGYTTDQDIRRKAEEVRDHLGLRLAPITDLQALIEAEGVVTYYAPLGEDLEVTISGAFVNHERLGFAILINSETSPGRQAFTLAHEYAHALFHSQRNFLVGCRSKVRDSKEYFADRFAAEFLVPTAALRKVMEHLRLPKRIVDPEIVIHLQRFFNVSYQAMLVRLRHEQSLSEQEYQEFLRISPIAYAERLGYQPVPEEYGRREESALRRYPHRFVEAVKRAYQRGILTPSAAAELLQVSLDEAMEVLKPHGLQADAKQIREATTEWGTIVG